ncbi:MAG: RNA polymerase factor sigma-54 [Gammaproteobacteria bacterium]|nr:RNA polymerase factor sigma-54 [Gammaproteobacteria bacterium]
MKQSLQLKVGQSLTMTPQLQQAIRLLQLSSLEMQQEIQEVLESNPLLELADEDFGDDPLPADLDAETTTESGEVDFTTKAESTADVNSPEADSDWDNSAEATDDWQENIPEDLPVDSSWDDVYGQGSSGSGSGGEDYDFDSRNGTEETLKDHLLWQLNLTRVSPNDKLIAESIIDAVNPDGLLNQTLEDILESLDPELEIELDEVVAVLHLLQSFDPTGICARNLQECLMLQLKELDEDIPWRSEALTVVGEYMDLLGNRDFSGVCRRAKLEESDLAEVIRLIQTLNPRPGASLEPSNTEYVVPDVFVRKRNNRWTVELNAESMPKLRINGTYAGMIRRADSSADNQFLKDNLQEARWFLKSLQSRNETLLKVVTKIVEHQRAFLEYGPEAMKPLVLHDIADAIGMHESTISRVTTRKYMHTPRGVFELKYFFSSHVGTATGGEVSSTAIRALIRKLTDEEDPRKPLSDSRIAQILGKQEIQVARRTIAKYRESMGIPPSNERKRLV